MVREFNESRLSKDSFGYYVFSMKCTHKDETMVHFRAIVYNKRLCSFHADFIHPHLAISSYCEENRRFLSALSQYLVTGISSVRKEEALQQQLSVFLDV